MADTPGILLHRAAVPPTAGTQSYFMERELYSWNRDLRAATPEGTISVYGRADRGTSLWSMGAVQPVARADD
jgi:hypothetical protein